MENNYCLIRNIIVGILRVRPKNAALISMDFKKAAASISKRKFSFKKAAASLSKKYFFFPKKWLPLY
jgi:hypothetical protein